MVCLDLWIHKTRQATVEGADFLRGSRMGASCLTLCRLGREVNQQVLWLSRIRSMRQCRLLLCCHVLVGSACIRMLAYEGRLSPLRKNQHLCPEMCHHQLELQC